MPNSYLDTAETKLNALHADVCNKLSFEVRSFAPTIAKDLPGKKSSWSKFQRTVIDANGQTASLKRLFFRDNHAKMVEEFLKNHAHGSTWKLLGCKGSKVNKLYSSASSAVELEVTDKTKVQALDKPKNDIPQRPPILLTKSKKARVADALGSPTKA